MKRCIRVANLVRAQHTITVAGGKKVSSYRVHPSFTLPKNQSISIGVSIDHW